MDQDGKYLNFDENDLFLAEFEENLGNFGRKKKVKKLKREQTLEEDLFVTMVVLGTKIVLAGILFLFAIAPIILSNLDILSIFSQVSLAEAVVVVKFTKYIAMTCFQCGLVVPFCAYTKIGLIGIAACMSYVIWLNIKHVLFTQLFQTASFFDIILTPLAIVGFLACVCGYLIFDLTTIKTKTPIILARTASLPSYFIAFLGIWIITKADVALEYGFSFPLRPEFLVARVLLQYQGVLLVLYGVLTGLCVVHSFALIGAFISILGMGGYNTEVFINPIFPTVLIGKFFLATAIIALLITLIIHYIYSKDKVKKLEGPEEVPKSKQPMSPGVNSGMRRRPHLQMPSSM